MTLQLEALLSIMRFQDNITQKWPKERTLIEKIAQENETTLSFGKTPDKSSENVVLDGG